MGYHDPNWTGVCERCGNEFRRYNSPGTKTPRFCSRSCRAKMPRTYRKANPKCGHKQEVHCAECGTTLLKYPVNPNTGKPIEQFFCNTTCKAAWQRRARPVTREWLSLKYSVEKLDCNAIGRMIKRDPKRVWEWLKEWGIPTRPRGHHTKGRKWTKPSPLRGRKGPRGPMSPAWQGGITPQRQAFYASDEWRSASKQVYSRDKKCCQRCGISQSAATKIGIKLNIHHIVGFRVKALRAEPSNLVLLCRPCHLFVHSKKNINRDFRSAA